MYDAFMSLSGSFAQSLSMSLPRTNYKLSPPSLNLRPKNRCQQGCCLGRKQGPVSPLSVFPAIVTGVERRRQCRENVRPQVKDKSAQAPAKGSPWDKGVIWIFPPWFKVPRATWVPPAVNVCSRVVLLLGSPCLSPQTANTMGVKQKQPSETCRKWNFYSRLKASANTFIVSHLCDWGQTKTGSNPRLLS